METKDNEFVRLAKGVMQMNNCSFPKAAEQLILAGRGPGKYGKGNIAKIDSKNKGEENEL
ncbi:hypothetical protein KKG58_00315 [Patescibacteria group bacterium]|nr:hypothetical protein [Patescibacteria group bacterium]